MAQTTLVPKIPLRTEKVNSQFKKSSKSLLQTQKSVVNINSLLKKRIKVRNEIFSNIFESKRRREYETRRMELEDERESRKSVVSGAVGNIAATVSKTGGSLIGRLMKSLGFIVAGWILRSLPTWIGYAKEFIARISELGRIIRSFVTNVGNIFQSSINVLSALKDNILKFDFFDSQRNLKNSFDELGKSIEGVQKDFEDTINVFTTDLTKEIDGVTVGSYSEEAIPEPGQGFTEDAPSQTQTYDSGSSSSGTGATSGTKEQRALLDAISFAEGTPSYGTIYGGTVVPELARGELTVKQVYDMMMSGKLNGKNVGYKSGSRATGKYQFMPDTLSDIVKTGAISWDEKFTPESQDRAILARISSFRGVTPELLAKEGISKNVVDKLAPEFASFPNLFGPDAKGRVGTNTSYYGQGGKKYEDIVREYNKSLQSQQSQAAKTSPQRSVVQPLQSALPKLPPTDTLGGGVQRYGASRDNGARRHAGVDFDISGNEKFYSRLGGEVIYAANAGGGYGNVVDIYNRELDKTERIAEAARILVKKGDIVSPGQAVVQGESSTGVIHYEIRKGLAGASGSFEGTLNPLEYLSSLDQLPRAQITSTSTQQAQQQVAQQITPERKAQDIVAVVPQSSPQQPAASQGSTPSQQQSAPSMGEVLNNFIKQKFLLDLSFL